MFRHTRLTELPDLGLFEYHIKSLAGWTPDSAMASRYIHIGGRVSVFPILEMEGIRAERTKIDTIPLICTRTCPRYGPKN